MNFMLRLASLIGFAAVAALAFACLSHADFWLAKFLVGAAIASCFTAD